jgi:flagellar biosynthesis protein FliR
MRLIANINPRRVGMHHVQTQAPILSFILGLLLALPVYGLVLLVDLAASGLIAIGW